MSLAVLVKPEAEADTREAYTWYEAKRPGLGDEFLLCLEAAIETARREPEACPTVHGAVRRAFTKRFPDGVFFVRESEVIVVHAVYHAARNPRGWQGRAES